MSSKFYEIDCEEAEPVIVEITTAGERIWHNYDPEIDLAAAELGFDEPSDCFVGWTAVADDYLDGELIIRADAGNLQLVDLLLFLGADPNATELGPGGHPYTSAPLTFAASAGHLAIVKLLLDNGADPSIMQNFALGFAAEGGHQEIVELLLTCDGVNLDDNKGYALKQAAEEGHAAIVRLLLDAGATVSAGRALDFAITAADNREIVDMLLAQPGLIDDHDKAMALSASAIYGKTWAIRKLLKAGIPLEAEKARIEQAIENAYDEGYPGIAQLIEDHYDYRL